MKPTLGMAEMVATCGIEGCPCVPIAPRFGVAIRRHNNGRIQCQKTVFDGTRMDIGGHHCGITATNETHEYRGAQRHFCKRHTPKAT